MKNIELDKVIKMTDEISYLEGQIVSKTFIQNKSVSMTLMAVWKGEEIGSHESDGDAMVSVLDGTGKFTVGEKEHIVKKGETLIMPSRVPHAVYGEENFKMLLTVIF